jgi:SAM-dependent methyltransferase
MTSLDLHGGEIVVDLGSGSGYFSIRLAPIVGPTGRVIAVDVLRQPLAFLWIRRLLRREWQIDIVRGQDDEPRLTVAPVDAVLVVNTYHELARPAATLEALRSALKIGGRLVVCDRRPRDGPGHRRRPSARATCSAPPPPKPKSPPPDSRVCMVTIPSSTGPAISPGGCWSSPGVDTEAACLRLRSGQGRQPLPLQRSRAVEIEVQFEHVDTRLAEETERTSLGVRLDEPTDVSLAHRALARHAWHLEVRGGRREVRVEA